MRLDQLTVNLRARSPWEAVELGTALVRRHAAAIWKPWFFATFPVFALLNLGFGLLDLFWLASLLLWWLKPAFDRIPLYVVSRAVFGAAPDTRETLLAQLRWGWGAMLHYLTWRRLSPARSLYLPVDLLEGGNGARERRRVLGGAVYSQALLLTWVCLHFELVLLIGSVATLLVFVPPDRLPETMRNAFTLLVQDAPWWAELGWNFVGWLAMGFIEPFYVGAGFSLYLNRRTQIEAWDVEIAFRRLRERLRSAAAPLALLLAVAFVPALRAQEREEPRVPQVRTPATEAKAESGKAELPTLPIVFGDQRADDRAFRKAAERAYADPQLSGTRKVKRWERRNPADPRPPTELPAWLKGLASVFAFLGEFGLWILAGLLVAVLLATAKHWLPWMRGALKPHRPLQSEAETEALQIPELLPPDIAASARRLWREGKPRHALALLYRASVEAMANSAQIVLPPGATEAECLRVSRRLADADERGLFARMVKTWQYAAYAQRLPGNDEFESLLGQLQRRYGWAG